MNGMKERSFGQLVRQFYLARGLNRHSFAKKIHASYNTVIGWEQRGVIPMQEKLQAIIRAMELSGDERSMLVSAFMEAGRPEADIPEASTLVTSDAELIALAALVQARCVAASAENAARLARDEAPAYGDGWTCPEIEALERALRARGVLP